MTEITRCYDPKALESSAKGMEGLIGFVPEELIKSPNVCLCRNSDLALFEYDREGVFSGHYFFNKSRGKDALCLAHEMLGIMFSGYGAEVIKGLTPLSNRPALLITAKLGFSNYGVIETEAGDMRLSILTKKEYR